MGRKHLLQKAIDSVALELRTQLNEMANEISECQLNEENKEVTVSIASYVAKTFSSRLDCNQCREKLIFNNKGNGDDHDKYLRLLSREGLIVPSLALADFNFQNFSILHYISPTIYKVAKTKISEKSPKTFYQNIWTKLWILFVWITSTGQLDFQCKLVSIFFIIMSRK